MVSDIQASFGGSKVQMREIVAGSKRVRNGGRKSGKELAELMIEYNVGVESSLL
jgi:restriction endonuclease Mrr